MGQSSPDRRAVKTSEWSPITVSIVTVIFVTVIFVTVIFVTVIFVTVIFVAVILVTVILASVIFDNECENSPEVTWEIPKPDCALTL